MKHIPCQLYTTIKSYINKLVCFSASPVGDACVDDYDGDGVPDNDDVCPHVTHISRTSFLDYFTVDLFPGHSDPRPEWRVAKEVK